MTEETQGVPSEPDAPKDGTGNGSSASAGKAGAGEAPGADDKGKASKRRVAELEQEAERLRKQLAERTGDLQRLQAEYQNYRKRVERDRQTVKEVAVAAVLSDLLPILDDIGRAREHNELVGGFKSVGESTEATAAKLGLEKFGEEGEPFDPTIHEALMHSYSADVEETTCVQILQPGYRLGERVLRPARVAVAEPQPGAEKSESEEAAEPAEAEETKANGKDADKPSDENGD
ncbi:nucleotide exchange factor GrpE [Mangrovactinospora gilvigrisea]|uniref:Protein GrpE n=1 Tax=Mangrovactinospora gilvigrisea TaxID=1428644 RepID=A0A1J7BCX6_9ACTN|nr:nucleotide exchange factor GrpE [Mangrovactinospora gilvigrisea]OIV36559.1 nucleotide exchange factor GrpE [Mangrovactinospora gilvigrisea]